MEVPEGMKKDLNGGSMSCEAHSLIEEISMHTKETLGIAEDIKVALSDKMDRLIDVIAGKNMLPVDSVKLIVSALLLFWFMDHFGIDIIERIIKSVKG